MTATATTMTGAEFDALPYEEGRQWELLDGELIEMSRSNVGNQRILVRLILSFGEYFRGTTAGGIYPDVEFAMGSNLRLCPDLSILLGEKWRTLDHNMNPLLLSPDLAVEIISPSERTLESTRKVRAYLANGVEEVWQIFPDPAVLLIHRAGKSIAVLEGTDVLETPLLPGWQMSLSELLAA